jgi:hypothetical protein
MAYENNDKSARDAALAYALRRGSALRRRKVAVVAAAGLLAFVIVAGSVFAVTNSGSGTKHVLTASDQSSTTESSTSSSTAVDAITTTSRANEPTVTTSATAAVCANSYDPACGAFHWQPAPEPLQRIGYTFSMTPQHPVAGESATVHVVVTSPQTSINTSELRVATGFTDRPEQKIGAPGAGYPTDCPPVRPRYGSWTPPPPQPHTLDLTFHFVPVNPYTTPISVELAMTMYAGYCDEFGPGAPPSDIAGRTPYNPYADYTSLVKDVTIYPTPATTTTDTTTP